jgi:hypothetical protein
MSKSATPTLGNRRSSDGRATNVRNPLVAFQSAVVACAHTILANVLNVQRELPTIDIPEVHRGAIAQICTTLVGTKHDVVSELYDLHDIERSAAPDVIGQHIRRVVQMLVDDLTQLDAVVRSLESASGSDQRIVLAYLLVAESAANILQTVAIVMDAAERYNEPVTDNVQWNRWFPPR